MLALLLFACTKDPDLDYSTDKPDVTDDSGLEESGVEDLDGDGSPADEDCDDLDSNRTPGAEEVCDGVDNDCDDEVDEDAGDLWYADADNDGFGDEADAGTQACEGPSGTTDNNEDCDDADGTVNPNQFEVCDEIDNNCDGEIDEDGAIGGEIFYEDADEDGYGADWSTAEACTAPSGYVSDDSDCNDSDGDVHPGATEECNLDDDDCDGDIDEGVEPTVWFADDDSDTYGDPSTGVASCTQPAGYVADDTDCDDTDADISPAGTESCDDVDEDCDGDIDEGATDGDTWYADTDSDGYGDASTTTESCGQPTGYVSDDTDCDDTDGEISPGEDELCDTVDNDCDGDVDEDSAIDADTWYADTDTDSYGDATSTQDACSQPSGYVSDDTDCDDTDSDSYPGADETCDSADNDCDGDVDEDATDATTWYADDDGDTYGDASSTQDACSQPSGYVSDDTDCDDTDADLNPGEAEICDGNDNDCDGDTDEGFTGTPTTWYADSDSDAYGDADTSLDNCDASAPSGYVSDDTDCDDTDGSIYPGATEYCDDADNDCDGTVDEDDAADASDWYPDSDSDGFGDDSASATTQCEAPSGHVADNTDCDDGADDVNPDELEYCDSTDHDCDGDTESGAVDTETWYTDSDGDGYGDDSSTTEACTQPSGTSDVGGDCDDTTSGTTTGDTYYADTDGDGYGDASSTNTQCSAGSGYVSDDTDCDDTDADISPADTEVCDDADNDCDGTVDEDDASDASDWYPDSDSDGFGDETASATTQCDAPSGYVADDSDCDDSADDVNPDELEYCDTTDHDCDGDTEAGAVDAETWYTDSDGDGYGDDSSTTDACTQPSGTSDVGGDCDDTTSGTTTGDTYYTDSDGDGYGDSSSTTVECAAGSGYVSDDTDCDDDDATTYPGASETCYDGVVNDCDGTESDALAACTLQGVIPSDDIAVFLYGDDAGDELGTSISSAGDQDGDGVDDIIFGAPYAESTNAKEGMVYIAYGLSSGLEATSADVTLTGTAKNDQAGMSVYGGEDFNGDGQDDVVIGADEYGSNTGAVFLYLGPVTASEILSSGRIDGVAAADCGTTMTGAGDMDADGTPDLLVGCERQGSKHGAIVLIHGPLTSVTDMNSSAYYTGDTSRDYAGASLASLGDTDGDGLDDVAAGAPGSNSGVGRFYVMLGPQTATVPGAGLGTVDGTGDGQTTSDDCGTALAGGDFDGDGLGDLAVGCSGAGTVAVFLGPVTGALATTSAYATLSAASGGTEFGAALTTMGDMDSDGTEELVVGAPNAGSAGAGTAWLFYGPSSGTTSTTSADAEINGGQTAALGTAMYGGDDHDGDGLPDLLLGAPNQDAPSGQGVAGIGFVVAGAAY
ncbi:MAG: hypothetical protein GY913_24640 [Proteobacteria bacterium]|nr:hypothetical protein [Pseudomonadota bacterium]